MSGTEAFRKSRPKKTMAKPIINSPQNLFFLVFENSKGKLIPINGREITLISTLKPNSDISQAVTVVPILAPIITPIDSDKANNPALTKLTTITVVAEDDWIRVVIKKPVKTPFTGFEVILAKILRILSPATFCSASLISFIPYKKKPKEPMSVKKSNNE